MRECAGNKNVLTTLKKGEAAVQRSEKSLMVVYDEDSIMERPGNPASSPEVSTLISPAGVTGGWGPTASSSPRLFTCWCHQMVSGFSKKTGWVWNFHATTHHNKISLIDWLKSNVLILVRQHYNGTNRGDVVYGVKMPSFDDPSCWKLKYSEKKLLYGKHRIAVGGAAPEGSSEGGVILILIDIRSLHLILQNMFHWILQKHVSVDFSLRPHPRQKAWQCWRACLLSRRPTESRWGDSSLLLSRCHQRLVCRCGFTWGSGQTVVRSSSLNYHCSDLGFSLFTVHNNWMFEVE